MVKSTGFRLASILIPTLLLILLGGVIYLVLRDNRATPLPAAQQTPTAPTTPVPPSPLVTEFLVSDTPPVPLDGMLRYTEMGIAFGPPQGYLLDLAAQAAILTAPDDSPAAETILVLRKENPADYASTDADDMPPGSGETELSEIFEAFVRFYAAQDGFAQGETAPVTIGGQPGLAVDLLGQEAGDFGGRVALTRPTDEHLFVMIGVGPTEVWRGQGLADYMAVLETVTFLDLQETDALPEDVLPETMPEPAAVEPTPTPITPEPEPTPTFTPAAPTPVAETPATQAPAIESTAETTSTENASPEETNGAPVEIPPADTPEPVPSRVALEPERWALYTNGNFVTGLAVREETLWAATTGGAVAWNLASGNHAKFTTADGLATNHLNTVAACNLPDFEVVLGGDRGLQAYTPESGTWRTLTTQSGELVSDEVVDVYCDPQAGYLAVLYPQEGIDIFDAEQNSWTHLALDMESLGEEVGPLRRLTGVPAGNALWVAAQRGLLLIQGDFTGAAVTGDEIGGDEITLMVFTPENSPLVSESITALTPAGENAIWVASNGAFYRTDGTDWDTFTQETVTGDAFPQGRINGLAVDADNLLWIASDQANLCRFDPNTAQCVDFFVNAPGMIAGPLSSLALDGQGRPYYGTVGNGISRYSGESIAADEPDDAVWETLVIDNPLSMGNTIRSFALDREGTVWIGAGAGATRVNSQDLADPVHYTPANSGLPFADITVIGADAQDSGIWAGAHGAARFDGNTWTAYHVEDNLVDAPIQAITADGVGRTWLGSRGAGISIWTGSSFFNLTADNGLSSEEITALASGGDVVWIGSRGGGLMRFQNNQLRFYTAAGGLPGNHITALALQPGGDLLIGTDRGLARSANGDIIPSAEMPSGAITALAVPPPTSNTPTEQVESEQIYWAVQEGTTLYWFDGRELFEIEPLPSWSPAPITALLLDGAGRLWVGFQRGGLALYTP